jgi:hypothetical protein
LQQENLFSQIADAGGLSEPHLYCVAKGEQDLIILGMKAHQVGAVVRDIPTIIGARTSVLTTQMGYLGGISSSTQGRTKVFAANSDR